MSAYDPNDSIADAAPGHPGTGNAATATRADRGDERLIEAGFPCHQVGAETQRERETGKQPPTSRLHVWWAQRPHPQPRGDPRLAAAGGCRSR
ncbi:MAG: DUF1156 domain-containing protein [Arhodomonas sp.]|nr:DUF1156 domain-containing protein [Arhodomonas sp.]